MRKIYLVTILLLGLNSYSFSQTEPGDTIPAAQEDDLAIDTTMDYDALLSELEIFLDSLLKPRSYFLASVSATPGYFNFTEKNNTRLLILKKLIYTPTIGYYHKSGLGLGFSGNLIDDEKHLNLYQFGITPSIDFLHNRKLIGGFSYTRYFTKDSLPFYTTPVKNEANGYIFWRKPWLQMSLSVNYGWGNFRDVKARISFINFLRLRRRIIDYLLQNAEANVSDFSVTASVLHHFYWLNIFSKKDNIRLTPQIIFTSGSQQFGLNQPVTNSTIPKTTRTNLVTAARELSLDEKNKFEPVSLSAVIKAEYDIGKFFIQPQFILDYYFPAREKNLSALFSISAGFVF